MDMENDTSDVERVRQIKRVVAGMEAGRRLVKAVLMRRAKLSRRVKR